VRADWNLYKKFHLLLKACKGTELFEDKTLISSHDFGYGLFLFFLSLIPPKFKWVGDILGFGGDRKKGIKYLDRAREENKIRG